MKDHLMTEIIYTDNLPANGSSGSFVHIAAKRCPNIAPMEIIPLYMPETKV